MKFTAKLRAAWVKNLRSGRYKQTRGSMYDDGKYCCLGVFAVTNRIATRAQLSSEGDLSGTFNRSDQWCPLEISLESTLIKLNDNKQASFKEIADWIEKNVVIQSGKAVQRRTTK